MEHYDDIFPVTAAATQAFDRLWTAGVIKVDLQPAVPAAASEPLYMRDMQTIFSAIINQLGLIQPPRSEMRALIEEEAPIYLVMAAAARGLDFAKARPQMRFSLTPDYQTRFLEMRHAFYAEGTTDA